MQVSGRLFFIIIIYFSARSYGSTETIGRHFLSLFGFRISERSAVRLRPFVYSPVIIIPTLNQKHSINVQENSENSYQDSANVFQKLTNDENSTNAESVDANRITFNDLNQDGDTDVDIDPREVANLRSSNNVTSATTDAAQTTTMSIGTETNTTEEVTEAQMETTKHPKGPYSAPKYNNEFVKNISLTTLTPLIQIKFALPENNDSWKMFAKAKMNELPKWYSNKIMTEDKWSRISPSYYFPGQFKPMAGLYHDGYLQKPLITKNGFVPSQQFY